jgi:hypothetical protein
MFPLSITTYVKMGVCVLLLGFSWYLGYSFEHTRFVNFQNVVREQAAIQEAKTKQIIEQQKITTDRITNDYKTELNRVHTMYTGLLNNGSTLDLSKPSNTLVSVNGFTTDPVFAAQCSATTAQLVSLQEFVKEQLTIK